MNTTENQDIQCTWWRPYALRKQDFPNATEYMRAMMRIYFAKLFEYEGYDATVQALDQWLTYCEQFLGGREKIKYGEPNDEITRWNCIIQAVNGFKDNPTEEPVSILDLPNQEDSTPSLVPNLQSNSENKPESNDAETVVETYFYEELEQLDQQESLELAQKKIEKIYFEFHEWAKIEREVINMKQDLARKFSKAVTQWSHKKFSEPESNRSSVEAYIAAKHAHLKALIPRHRIYPTLMRHVKSDDVWGKLDQRLKTFEDELSLPRGICNAHNRKILRNCTTRIE
jgi:hypothetical protein